LVMRLADPLGDPVDRFARLARTALEHSGGDVAALDRTFWVEEFLAVLPRRLLSELRTASQRDQSVHGLVEHLLQQHKDAGADEQEPASPGEFRYDLIELVHNLEAWARAGQLPGYLPVGVDTAALSQAVRIRSRENGQLQLWAEIAAEHRRLVVLAAPGLGKSWLIRSETRRLCQDALTRLDGGDRGEAIVPVPLRCDQLARTPGQDLAEKASACLIAQGFLRDRSLEQMAAKIRGGQAVLLLDALDEVISAQDEQFRELLRRWAEQEGGRARCVITSQVAGYTGSPVTGACEVELQTFTADDVSAVIGAWNLPADTAAWLRSRVRDRAIAMMARIPLLLALMCSLSASPAGVDLTRIRGQFLDRMLRWFSTRMHRRPDDIGLSMPKLAGQEGRGVTEALIDLLADPRQSV